LLLILFLLLLFLLLLLEVLTVRAMVGCRIPHGNIDEEQPGCAGGLVDE